MSVQNQKIVQIARRTKRDKDNLYAMTNLEALQQAMSTLKGSGLKMWLYLNKNQDNYRLELSRVACEEWGIKKDSYYDGIRNFIYQSSVHFDTDTMEYLYHVRNDCGGMYRGCHHVFLL